MHKEGLKPMSCRKTGGEENMSRQVDIIAKLLEQKMHDLETLDGEVKMCVEEHRHSGIIRITALCQL